jgi:ATP/maltotriose-dependent transcriptional regulator MalT
VPTALDEAHSVLDDARAEHVREIEGRALVLLAEIALRSESDAAQARLLGDEALETLPEDELHGLHEARSLLATIAWWIGDADASRRHNDAATELARALGRPDLESLALTRLAQVASATGALDDALELSQRATELALESGSREAIGWARTVGGRCAMQDADLERAEVELREGLAAFEDAGAAGRAGWATSILGGLELRRGDLERAEEVLREAVRQLRSTREGGFLIEAERQLAEVLVRAGKLPEAERLAEHARKTVGREDVWSRASTLHALGLVRTAQGRFAEAEGLLQEALAIVEPTMYHVFAQQVRSSLDALHGLASAAVRT